MSEDERKLERYCQEIENVMRRAKADGVRFNGNEYRMFIETGRGQDRVYTAIYWEDWK